MDHSFRVILLINDVDVNVKVENEPAIVSALRLFSQILGKEFEVLIAPNAV